MGRGMSWCVSLLPLRSCLAVVMDFHCNLGGAGGIL